MSIDPVEEKREQLQDDTNRLKIFLVSKRVLWVWLMRGKNLQAGGCLEVPVVDLPEDAVIQYLSIGTGGISFEAVIHSQSFEVVKSGDELPRVEVEYRMVQIKVEKSS